MSITTVSSGQTSTGTTLNNSGSEYVYGTAISTTVNSGGNEYVYSGGTASDTTVTDGGNDSVHLSGTTIGTTVSSGGFENIYGGTAIDTTVSAGGLQYVKDSGVAVDTIVVGGSQLGEGGTQVVSNGSIASNTSVGSNAIEAVNSNASAIDTVLDTGGYLLVYPGGSASGTTGGGTVVSTGLFGDDASGLILESSISNVTIGSGGGIEVFPEGATLSVSFVGGSSEGVHSGGVTSATTIGSGSQEVIFPGGLAVSTTVSSGGYEILSGGIASDTVLQLGGQIDLTALTYVSGGSASLDTATDVLTVRVGSNTYTQQLTGSYLAGEKFVVAAAEPTTVAPGTLVTAACYRAGTLIRTDRGEVPVEQLRAGDRVASAFGGTVDVTWLGHRRVDCRRHPKPRDVWPVRIAAGAFGDKLPQRDLFLSPDHAVHVDGVLIPVRYLVNGATVVQAPADTVTYWHIELQRHDVVFAEGLPAESYLDTGNRGAFANGGVPTPMHPDFALRVWAAEACAPLVRDGAMLVAVRGALLERAERLGHAITRDAHLHVVIDGRVVRPTVEGRVHRFLLARAGHTARLVSRSAIPAAVRADSDDDRRLGVAVSRIALDGTPIALGDARLGTGWHRMESSTLGGFWRWTDGDAELAVPRAEVLETEVAMTERYWVADGAPAARRRNAAAR